MSGSEVIGDLAQGALTARTLEPDHGESGDGHSHESACLNCGTALLGSHCHQCGQAAHVHRTLGAFFHDLRPRVFRFESKIWRISAITSSCGTGGRGSSSEAWTLARNQRS